MDLTTNKYRIEVGVRELKNQLSRYIDQVREGKEVIVTEHGKPVARLTMLTEQDDRLWMNCVGRRHTANQSDPPSRTCAHQNETADQRSG